MFLGVLLREEMNKGGAGDGGGRVGKGDGREGLWGDGGGKVKEGEGREG